MLGQCSLTLLPALNEWDFLFHLLRATQKYITRCALAFKNLVCCLCEFWLPYRAMLWLIAVDALVMGLANEEVAYP
jgi:hypothetical protein